jgi:hypothetical protein
VHIATRAEGNDAQANLTQNNTYILATTNKLGRYPCRTSPSTVGCPRCDTHSPSLRGIPEAQWIRENTGGVEPRKACKQKLLLCRTGIRCHVCFGLGGIGLCLLFDDWRRLIPWFGGRSRESGWGGKDVSLLDLITCCRESDLVCRSDESERAVRQCLRQLVQRVR